ncbi:MAG TPA: acetylornithine deacetylase [Stellaceae bacterium]|jgi:acetylornithine deacetylase|nr:acetylornithine deacetylase [Stellaceae bacterium]
MTQAAVAILERLVAFDTVSATSNLDLVGWVADYLDGLGIESVLTRNAEGTKANLYATVGPGGRGGIILSGHTDVVPVAGQAWTSDPFRLDARGERLYGRGTADMKGFIALVLAMVPNALASPLQIPLHIALSYDEEVGCLGVPALIRSLPEGAARPRLAIIGEPTGMQVGNAHKGIHFLRTRLTGHEAHSSMPERGVNAIAAAAEIIVEIGRLAAQCRAAAPADSRFDPPYTSFNIGRIAGGAAVNIIARDCAFDWEFRPVPGEDAAALRRRIDDFIMADLLPRLRAGHPDAAVETETMALVPPLVPDPGSPAETLARDLTGANEATTIAFATEAGLFQAAGIPAVICGPGSIEVAHQPDEFITRDQLAAGGAFLDRLLAWARRGGNERPKPDG